MFRIGSGAFATGVPSWRARAGWLLALGMLLGACEDDGPTLESPPTSEEDIDPATGGDVVHTDGSKLVIPPGALPPGDPVPVSITLASDATAPAGAASGVWRFGPAGTQFAKPVTVELPFPLEGRNPARYTIAWTRPGTEAVFDDMPTTFANGTAKTEVTHFSLAVIRELPFVPLEPIQCNRETSLAVDSDDEDSVADFCQCRSGYTKQGDECVDINECDVDNGDCDELTDCINFRGGFMCGTCPPGFTGNGEDGCTDINECETDRGGCGKLAPCENMPGSFRCGGCPAGYLGGGEEDCVDLDECRTNNGGCDAHAKCLNVPGTVMCGDCESGFVASGTRCLPVPPPSSEKEITEFILAGAKGKIVDEDGTITVTVPYKATLASLMPTIEYIGESISPTTPQDFTRPVMYAVKAADGSVKQYSVDATRAVVSSAKQIKSLKVDGIDGVFGGIDGKTITVTLPVGTVSLDSLPLEIVHDGTVSARGLVDGRISFVNHIAQDFVVEAEDGTTETYSVVANIAEKVGNTIRSFKLNGVDGVFGGVDGKTITVTLPFVTATLNNLVPEILADGPVTPPSGTGPGGAINFVENVAKTFTVIGDDGPKEYDVIVKRAAEATALIKSLKIGDVEGVFSGVNNEIITVVLPYASSLLGLVPKIISDGQVTPPSGDPNGALDFINGAAQKFLVTAADGTTKKTYDVVVKNAENADNLIKSFSIGDVQGVINNEVEPAVIKLVMPFGTALQELVPKIVSEGTVTANGLIGGVVDFSNEATQRFTSTANNGVAKAYNVTVETAANTTALIYALNIGETPGVFSGAANDVIKVTLPVANSLLGLVPTIVSSGTVTAEGLVNGKIDFLNGIAKTFTVTAEDGRTTADYLVTVEAPRNANNLIHEFDINGIAGVFSGPANDIITLTLPFATSLLNVAPRIVTEGTVSAVGYANGRIDFTNHAVNRFKVTADNGLERFYDVIVNVPDVANNVISGLKINDVPGVFSGLANNIISVVLPFGTSLTQVAPEILSNGTVTADGYVDNKLDLVAGVAKKLTVMGNGAPAADYWLLATTALSGANSIHSFDIRGVKGVFSGANNDIITTTLPFATPLEHLVPTIAADGPVTAPTLVDGVMSALDGVSTPFTVTAKNGVRKVYDVIVKNALNNATDIQSFKIGGVDGVISGDTINATLPFGASLLNLTPQITTAGKSVTAPGFENGVVSFLANTAKPFTVTAMNDVDTRTYNVTLKNALDTAKDIHEFKLNGFDGKFSGPDMQNIDVSLPFGTLPTGLRPSIVHDGTLTANGNPLTTLLDFVAGTARPFVVTAADMSTKTYNVKATIESLMQANEIKKFELLGQLAEIDEVNHTITLKFPVHKQLNPPLFPPVIVSNALTVLQSLGTTNFTQPVSYTAVARDGTPQVYPVTIINPP
jgi:hypothetical protein